MLRLIVKTERGIVRVYDNGKVLLKPKGKVKWHKLEPSEGIFRGVGYKQHKRKKGRRQLRVVG